MHALMLPREAKHLTRFARNRVVLAASRGSAVAELLTRTPWQHTVTKPGIRIGFADPEQAPVGARTMTALRENDAVVGEEGLRVGSAPLDPRFMRPDVAKLIAPLETGEIDAAFVYESEARQYGFAYAKLDQRIDGSATTFYAATVPHRARHPRQGQELLDLLVSETGRQVAAARFLEMLDQPQIEGEPQ